MKINLAPISNVESRQQVVEAVVPHLPGVQHNDTQEITNNTKYTETFQYFSL